MTIICYSYDADYHCRDCMLEYAKSVEYKDYFWGVCSGEIENKMEELLYSANSLNDSVDIMKAIEMEVIRDSEGNPIHPLFSWDEWYNIGYGDDSICCSDCGMLIDEYKDS